MVTYSVVNQTPSRFLFFQKRYQTGPGHEQEANVDCPTQESCALRAYRHLVSAWALQLTQQEIMQPPWTWGITLYYWVSCPWEANECSIHKKQQTPPCQHGEALPRSTVLVTWSVSYSPGRHYPKSGRDTPEWTQHLFQALAALLGKCFLAETVNIDQWLTHVHNNRGAMWVAG